MENHSSFSVRNLNQIVDYLLLLQKSHCLLSVTGSQSGASFITNIIEINKKNHTLVIDYGPKAYLNRALISDQKASFVSDYKGIKVAFHTSHFKEIQHEGKPAFMVPIPESIFWMERREFYRVHYPISKNSYCEFALPEQPPVKFQLYDLSVSGFSILVEEPQFQELLPITRIIEDALLVFEDFAEGKIGFEVRSRFTMQSVKSNAVKKIGSRFISITPAFQSLIQQHINQIERLYKMNK